MSTTEEACRERMSCEAEGPPRRSFVVKLPIKQWKKKASLVVKLPVLSRSERPSQAIKLSAEQSNKTTSLVVKLPVLRRGKRPSRLIKLPIRVWCVKGRYRRWYWEGHGN